MCKERLWANKCARSRTCLCVCASASVCVCLPLCWLQSLLIAVETPLINTKRDLGGARGYSECVTSLDPANLWDTTA